MIKNIFKKFNKKYNNLKNYYNNNQNNNNNNNNNQNNQNHNNNNNNNNQKKEKIKIFTMNKIINLILLTTVSYFTIKYYQNKNKKEKLNIKDKTGLPTLGILFINNNNK
jgi:hypothetical protein